MPVSADPGRSTLLVTTAPQVTDEEASAIALQSFGVVANAKVLTSERDKNFHMQAADGREFVLKVTNSAEDPAVTNLQTEALRHVELHAPHLPVPRVCPTLDGRFEAVVTLANGSDHLVRLLTFLSGEPLYKTAPSLRQSSELGTCLAAINLALRDFRHSAASHELLWDLKRASKLRALLPYIADERRLALATEGLDYYEQRVQPVVAAFRTQVVHNDFNPHNVLVDPDDPTRVTGVIDFGDMVETQLVNDVAIAASYQVEGEDLLARAAKFVAAYHSVYRLTLAEIDSLFDLITLRQIMTVAITEWRASLYPDNKSYILRNHPRAAAALETLNRVGRAKACETLRRACDME
jgi:Ser/Thr protein kinase RdoA (MazF antagonist)